MGTKFIKRKPSQMTVDPRYQREFDESRARTIAKSLDPALLGVPVLSQRKDGTLVILDAQHRMGACKIAGFDDEVFCEVHDGLSLQEEAALFLRLNGARRAVRVYDKFKAQLVARDPVSLDIDAIVKKAGCRVTKAPAKRGICAIQALVRIYHLGNLAETLRVVMDWSDDGDAAYLEGTILRSISLFLGKYPEVNLAELAKKLQPHAADRVLSKIRRMQGAWNDMNPTLVACSVFREIYNHRRAKKSQLPPPDVEPTQAEAAE